MIDDHPPIIEGYKSILSFNPFGYEVNTTSAFSCEAAYKLITSTHKTFDLVLIDYTMPPFPEKNIHNGSDLIAIVRAHLPGAKVMILTSHSESFLLLKILKECNPEGLLVKSDFHVNEFLDAFDTVFRGENYYSITIEKLKKELAEKAKVLDSYNMQIIMLLAKGVQTKNLPDYLHLSKSAIDKRKVFIKEFFGLDKGTDEDLLREARKKGYI